MKSNFGKILPNTDKLIVQTKRSRLFALDVDPPTCIIMCSIEELEKLLISAKKSKEAGLFFRHLSPDVTFGFMPKSSKWLKRK